MGLFNRLFGPKQPAGAQPERIKESVATMEEYLRGIMVHYGEAHFDEIMAHFQKRSP